MSNTITSPRIPAPTPKYDRENEAQFRAMLERTLREITDAIRALQTAATP